jgi:hypothetical protein
MPIGKVDETVLQVDSRAGKTTALKENLPFLGAKKLVYESQCRAPVGSVTAGLDVISTIR